MQDFLGSLSQIAAGSLQGRSQAINDAASQQDQASAAAQRMMLARMKQQADEATEMRGRAFTYAGELQKSLTPDNLKYLQDNNLLDQFHREIGSAMSVAAGQTPHNQWNPQFAFSDQPDAAQGPATGMIPTTSPHPASPTTGPPSAATMLGISPRLAGPLPMGGSATGPFGPVGPPLPPATMPEAPAPVAPKTQFPLTEAQQITERQTGESEASGAETRRKNKASDLLAEKEFNLKVAEAQLTQFFKTADFRKGVGEDAYKDATGLYTKFLDKVAEFAKAGGDPSNALKSLLTTPNALGGRMPNATAIRSYLLGKGVDPGLIDQILQDPAMAASGIQGAGAARQSMLDGGNLASRGGGLTMPGRMAGVGTGPPVLPPVGVVGTTDQQTADALRARGTLLGRAPTANRGAVAPPPVAGAAPGSRAVSGSDRTALAVLAREKQLRAQGLGEPAITAEIRKHFADGPIARAHSLAANAGRPVATSTNQPRPISGDPHAIAAIPQMQPAAQAAARAGFKALSDAGVQFTVNSTARSPQEQAAMYQNRGSNPNPVAPPGTSMHEQGLAIDLSNTSGSQQEMAKILAPFGWKWGGVKDPVHFTYVSQSPTVAFQSPTITGTTPGSAPTRSAKNVPSPSTASPVPPAKAATVADAAGAVGIKTPATAAPVQNPYPEGSLGGLIFNSLQNGQQNVEEIMRHYADQPEKQKVVQEVAERYKGMQAGNLMGGIPTPSLEGAEVPTQAGIGSLGNLMYNDPEVGKPNVTTEPIESTPLSTRQQITQRKTIAPVPPVAAGKEPASGGGGLVPQPTPPRQSAAKPPARPDAGRSGPSLLAVPPPPQPGPSLMSPPPGPEGKAQRVSAGRGPVIEGVSNDRLRQILAQDQKLQQQYGSTGAGTRLAEQIRRITGRQIDYDRRTGAIVDPSSGTTFHRGQPHANAGRAVTPGWFMTAGPSGMGSPAAEKPKIMNPGPGPTVPFSPRELQVMQGDLRAYASSPYRKGVDHWLKQQGLDSVPNRHFYYDFVHREFVPKLIRSGIPPNEVAKNLEHYLRANQSFGRVTTLSAADRNRMIAGSERKMSLQELGQETSPAQPGLVPAPDLTPGPPAFRSSR